MHSLTSTITITTQSPYQPGAAQFFSFFSDAWSDVRGQILKLETRQTYCEPGNPSYEALERGDFDKALELLPQARSEDVALYASLTRRRIDFIRCRPIITPITEYLRWELECYKFNADHGERIYFLDRSDLFDEYALHDFMVFDRHVAFIHDYSTRGELRGGWIVKDTAHIDSLLALFSVIKAASVHYLTYRLE